MLRRANTTHLYDYLDVLTRRMVVAYIERAGVTIKERLITKATNSKGGTYYVRRPTVTFDIDDGIEVFQKVVDRPTAKHHDPERYKMILEVLQEVREKLVIYDIIPNTSEEFASLYVEPKSAKPPNAFRQRAKQMKLATTKLRRQEFVSKFNNKLGESA